MNVKFSIDINKSVCPFTAGRGPNISILAKIPGAPLVPVFSVLPLVMTSFPVYFTMFPSCYVLCGYKSISLSPSCVARSINGFAGLFVRGFLYCACLKATSLVMRLNLKSS